ncbi:MAG: hypothetical protein ABSF00_05985 [Candidatus Bathyarchaeia archaeon]
MFAGIGGLIIQLIIAGIIGGIFVWLAGKALGAPRATYWHGILIVVLAIIVSDIIGYFLSGLGWIRIIIEIIVILLLIKHFFAVGWVKAIVIAILAVVIAIIVTFVLALIGLAFAATALKGLIPGL